MEVAQKHQNAKPSRVTLTGGAGEVHLRTELFGLKLVSHRACRRALARRSASWGHAQGVAVPDRPPSDLALLRFHIISGYLTADLPRGQRGPKLQELASRTWELPDGREVQFAAETLRGWVRRYRQGGLAALENAPRPRRGVQVLTDEHKAILCRLKRDVPARSIDRIIEVAEETNLVPKGLLKRSTVHRVLHARGLSARKKAETATDDLDRFEAAFPNDLWQSDMLAGPWLPAPDRPGKQRRAWLHAWLDDHSRLLLAGRWAFKSDLPTLELTLREALRRCGLPKRVYYDNGGPYRSKHMAQIIAVLSDQRPIFTPPYRPEGHGKIEAFNRYCRAAFVEEVRASSIQSIDELNRAFLAWRDLKYNRRVHSETGEAPWDRWRAEPGRIIEVSERLLTEAFLFRAKRTTDKAGVLKLHGVRYQVGPELARKRLEVRYEPEDTDLIEVWYGGTFQERVRPLTVRPQRRPKAPQPDVTPDPDGPVVDYLGELVERHKPLPVKDEVQAAREEQRAHTAAVVAIFVDHLRPEVVDTEAITNFVERFGPISLEVTAEHLAFVVQTLGDDPHIQPVLNSLREALSGDNA